MTRKATTAGRQTPTILGTLPIDLAPSEMGRLFNGLEAVVNCGDSLNEYQNLSKGHASFWPSDPGRAWNPKDHASFIEYRDQLRALWNGSLNEEQRPSTVAYLLGLIDSEEFHTLWLSGPEALFELWAARSTKATNSTVSISHSFILPVWGNVGLRFYAQGDFEAALWALFRESWRARVCGQCKRYFIAAKAAQRYCSTKCYGAAKREQRLTWWNKTGSLRRKGARGQSKKSKVARSK